MFKSLLYSLYLTWAWIILQSLLFQSNSIISWHPHGWQRNQKGREGHKSDTRQRICFLSLLIRFSITNTLIVSAQGLQGIISLGLKLDCTLRAVILNILNHGQSKTNHQEDTWAATNTHKHSARTWPEGVQVQTNTEVKSLGNVHTTFLESVMVASGFMSSQWQTLKYEQSVE